jgi:hypothetical protein
MEVHVNIILHTIKNKHGNNNEYDLYQNYCSTVHVTLYKTVGCPDPLNIFVMRVRMTSQFEMGPKHNRSLKVVVQGLVLCPTLIPTYKMGPAVILQTCIWEVLRLNFGQNTGYSDRDITVLHF